MVVVVVGVVLVVVIDVVVVAFVVVIAFVVVVAVTVPAQAANVKNISQAAKNIAAIFFIFFLPLFCRCLFRLRLFADFSHGFYKGYYEELRRFLFKQIFTSIFMVATISDPVSATFPINMSPFFIGADALALLHIAITSNIFSLVSVRTF